jgi:hypothetical protein
MAVVYYNWHSGCFAPLYPYPFVRDLGAWVGGLVTNQLTVDIQRMVYLPLVLRDQVLAAFKG